jgi:hypothetical protein
MKIKVFTTIILATIILTSCSDNIEQEVYSSDISIVSANPIDILTDSPSVTSFAAPNITPIIKSVPAPTLIENDINTEPVPFTINIRKIQKLPDLPKHINKKDEIAPEGWSLLDSKKNDFNGDGLKDIVGVIEHPINDEIMYPRILFIYFNTGDGYNLNFMNSYIIRNSDEGGVFGDPYEELTVSNNTFTTNAFGGSAWKWSENYTFEFKNEQWYLLSAKNYYGYGGFETSYSYDNYSTGIGFRRVTEESPDKENPEKLEYNVKLDKQPLLEDYATTLFFRIERMKAPTIKSVSYNNGIEHFEGDFPELGEYDILAWNKEYFVYHIKQAEDIAYIGVLSLRTKNLQMIARYDNGKQEEVFSDFKVVIYNNRLYYEVEISKDVSIRSEGIVSNSNETVAVQLISMNLDGTDKKIIFNANHPQYTENNIIEDYLSYLSLSYEISGNEIIVMVYGDANQPYYRMNLQGKDKSLIGSVPAGDF